MSNELHTKTEWLITGSEGTFVYSLNEKEVNQFSLLLQGNAKNGSSNEELRANARLIKEAPRMFEQLKNIQKLIGKAAESGFLTEELYYSNAETHDILKNIRGLT